MANYQKLNSLFDKNEFRILDENENGEKFYYLRSISRGEHLRKFCEKEGVELTEEITKGNSKTNKPKTVKTLLEEVFNNEKITFEKIKNFIDEEYKVEVALRDETSEDIVKELNRVRTFDWGGSFGNSLEKNIVNNYVKKISSYDNLTDKIDTELLQSLRGYTINSWYNHWSSILIEDIFKEHSTITPTIGLVAKIDFFVDDVPYDLKVTYFPEQYMKEKIKEKGFGVELTRVKQAARIEKICIDDKLSDRDLNIQLQELLKEKNSIKSRKFLKELKKLKGTIIREAMKNPDELIKWLYENQGAARFDASNRFFLILTDVDNIYDSWKLKRNISLLRTEITKKLNAIKTTGAREMKFYWEEGNKEYDIKADILFIAK